MTRFRFGTALVFALMMTAAASQAAPDDDGPRWPNLPFDTHPDPPLAQRPAFVDPVQVSDRILGTNILGTNIVGTEILGTKTAQPADHDGDITGSTASWPNLPPEQPVDVNTDVSASMARWPALHEAAISPFNVEVGARYWFSGSTIRFGFTNNNPFFGNPTSTLYWKNMLGHAGEAFARFEHQPSGWFVKGLIGGGAFRKGRIEDVDFLVDQFEFSDTTSAVMNGNLDYGMIDVGWAYQPLGGMRFGFFVGYHYWRETVSANGIRCNQASFVIGTCPAAGAVPVGFDVPVFDYEPTWHAVRIGFDARFAIADRWSVTSEIAAVPYAFVRNKDSHLLRQSMADLGPAPNVIADSRYAFGVEAEMFLDDRGVIASSLRNLEIGGGVRYWGLMARSGDVKFGPSFAPGGSLTRFEQQRFGLLFHVKGRF